MIQILHWKGADIWQIMFAWMVYVVPHFRYGSLMFYPEVGNNKKIPNYTKAYIKLYNSTLKKTWRLPRNTEERIIKSALGQWNAEVIMSTNYTRNANKWAEIFRTGNTQ